MHDLTLKENHQQNLRNEREGSIMAKLKTEFKSTKPNPDEEHLRTLWQAENRNLARSLAEEVRTSQRRKDNKLPLLKAGGLNDGDIARLLKEDKSLSNRALSEARQKITVPPVGVDFEDLQKRDLKLVQTNAERMELHNPSWYGYDWASNYGGWWKCWNGEAEEVPSVGFNVGADRFDPRAQAYGEGWFDGDFSTINAYLAFQFRPPSWGHLHINISQWLHGYYILYSNEKWYTSGYARAELDTWIQVHQNYWRPRHSHRRFTCAGDELHPTRSGRIDGQYGCSYTTNVGEGDLVTVRVGVRLHCYARASGSFTILNFQAGAANYVYEPYLYWYLHH